MSGVAVEKQLDEAPADACKLRLESSYAAGRYLERHSLVAIGNSPVRSYTLSEKECKNRSS